MTAEPGAHQCARLELPQPILNVEDMEALKRLNRPGGWRTQVLDATFPVDDGPMGLRVAIARLCSEAQAAVEAGGFALLCLTDRSYGPGRAPVPSLLAAGAVHHHLVQLKLRSRVGLLVDSGEPREVRAGGPWGGRAARGAGARISSASLGNIWPCGSGRSRLFGRMALVRAQVHQFCLLMGYGADAVCPYLAFESIAAMQRDGKLPASVPLAELNSRFVKGVGVGILK